MNSNYRTLTCEFPFLYSSFAISSTAALLINSSMYSSTLF